MATINWDKIFADYPNDPDDHLVASDYYEDLQDMAKVMEHRRMAVFWEWIKEVGCRPDCWGTGFWWHLLESNWIRLSPRACVPNEVFIHLGKDIQEKTSKDDEGLVYPTEHDAWEALYKAWSVYHKSLSNS